MLRRFDSRRYVDRVRSDDAMPGMDDGTHEAD
jgi:hypothetical protein